MRKYGIPLLLLTAIVAGLLSLSGLGERSVEKATVSRRAAPEPPSPGGAVAGRLEGAAAIPPLRDAASPVAPGASGKATMDLAGRVLGPDGAPVAGVALDLVRAEGTLDESGTVVSHHHTPLATTHSDTEGRFRFASVAAARYALWARPRDAFLDTRMNVDPGMEDVVVRLRGSVRATLEVIDWQGLPVGDARVEVWSGGTRIRKTEADARGLAELSRMDPDDEHLTLNVLPPKESVERGFPYEEKGWTPRDQVVQLERAFSVTGGVVDSQGRPVPGAMVWALAAEDESGERSARGFDVDETGAFRIAPLREGPVELVAALPEAPGSAFTHPTTSMEAGAADVRLVLVRGSDLVVRVRDWPTVANVKASLVDEADPSQVLLKTIGTDGVVVIPGVRTGRSYLLWIPLEEDYVLEHGIRAGDSPLDVEIRPGGVVEGRIRLPEGASLTHAELRRPTIRKWAHVDLGDNTFRCGGLPPGRWTLSLRAALSGPGGTKPGSATLEVEVGDRIDTEPEWAWER